MRAHRWQEPFRRSFALALAALATAAGCDCGDNFDDNPGLADAARVDAPLDGTPVDAATCDTPAPGAIGGSCSTAATCGDAPDDAGTSPFCFDDLLPEAWPAEGVCTIFGCTEDSQCGDGNTCAIVMGFGACLPSCCDEVGVGDACETGRLCADSLFGEPIMTEACLPGTVGAADGDACATFAECDRNSVCRSDKFQFPGGQCAVIECDADTDCAPGGDGRCVDLPDEVQPVCVDACDSDADCRQDQGYRCIDRGGNVGKFCQHPGPGDSCTADLDCGVPDQPSPTEQWACREGVTYPGGYCTVEECDPANNDTCPIFSFCVGLVGEADTFCADECATPGGNECGAGYRCANVQIGPGTQNVCLPSAGIVDEPPQI